MTIGKTKTLLVEKDGGGTVVSTVRRTVLPGGLRVITEQMGGVRSASIGVWVGVGSRDEAASLAGSSHFLEHLLFKGTLTRSAMDISAALDGVSARVSDRREEPRGPSAAGAGDGRRRRP